MVVHLRNYAHPFKDELVLVALIGKYQNSGKNTDQQIIDQCSHPAYSQIVQQCPQSNAKKKDPEAQAEAV